MSGNDFAQNLQDGPSVDPFESAITPETEDASPEDAGNSETITEEPAETPEGEEASEETSEEAKEEAETEESEESEEDKPEDSKEKAAVIDEKLTKFVEAKGIDAETFESLPENVQKALESYKSSESELGKTKSEVSKLKSNAEAANLQLADAAANSVSEVSPINAVEDKFVGIIKDQCKYHGCKSELELKQNFPEVYNRLYGMYTDEKDKARDEQANWIDRKKEAERKQDDARRRQEARLIEVRDESQRQMAKAREEVKDFDKALADTGGVKFLERLSDAMGYGTENFTADHGVMEFLVPAVKALSLLQGGEIQKQAKESVEKQIKKAKTGELVSASDPLPDDHTAAFAAFQDNGRGTSF